MSQLRQPSFREGEALAALRWWHRRLLEQKQRGARAALRRAHTLDQVFLTPAYQALVTELERVGFATQDAGTAGRIAALAGLAAHTDAITEGTSFATQMAEGNVPQVSEARFRRLLEVDDVAALYPLLRRVLALMGRHANLADLALSLAAWNTEHDRRRHWAYDYYQKAPRKETKA